MKNNLIYLKNNQNVNLPKGKLKSIKKINDN
jgi:hypothetical protein